MPSRIASAIDQAVDAYGFAAVSADVEGGGYRTVTLEPQSLRAMSRAAIAKALDGAGFTTANHDEGIPGYSMRREDGVYRVFWSGDGGTVRKANVPPMAKALRETGYRARTSHDAGDPMVNVSGIK